MFIEPIKALAEESVRGLEDIQDKEYAQSIIDEASSLAGSLKPFEKAYDDYEQKANARAARRKQTSKNDKREKS